MKRQAEDELNELDAQIYKDTPEDQPCKKAKLEATSWSLSSNNLVLDEYYDSGVKLLDSGSETSEECVQEQKNGDLNSIINSGCAALTPTTKEKQVALLQATLTKEVHSKISQGDWSSLDKNKNVKIDTYKGNRFDLLSDEVVLHILQWIPTRNLKSIALVCKRFYQLCQDASLWTRMDASSSALAQGALGRILSRQILLLKLAQAKIACPTFMSGVKASLPDFRARLMYLDLSMASISQSCLTELLTKCYRLKKISLEHIPVNDEVIRALSKSKGLEVINFAMVEGITTEGMKCLLNSCRKLKDLNIAWTDLSSCCIKFICSNLPPTMDRLNLSGCRKYMLDKHVASLVSTCPNLRELDLSDCTGLTGNCIQYIILLEDLNFLALSRCYFIPYRALLALKTLRSLSYLDIHGGHLAGDELKMVGDHLGSKVHINKFKFSSVARPTVGPRRSSIWGLSLRD